MDLDILWKKFHDFEQWLESRKPMIDEAHEAWLARQEEQAASFETDKEQEEAGAEATGGRISLGEDEKTGADGADGSDDKKSSRSKK